MNSAARVWRLPRTAAHHDEQIVEAGDAERRLKPAPGVRRGAAPAGDELGAIAGGEAGEAAI